MYRILLADDDPSVLLGQMAQLLDSYKIEIDVARSGREAIEKLSLRTPDVVLLDISLPDMSGLEVSHRLREIDARIPVIFITATTTTHSAIQAMRQGAYDYLFKPVDRGQLEKVVGEALKLGRRMREPAIVGKAPSREEHGDAIIGRCPGMLEVYKEIGRVADQKVMVLITGESGTGKELVARAIYQHSDRAQSPFLAINCAAIPENLLESELFGHEKGAFTGADRRRIGKFEQCNGGTIFLDEVGDMPMATQGKILRLLQDQKFERIGGNQTIETDVRLIAATNRDLKSWAELGKFRPDLYYRLSVFTINLPPLRERGTDLDLLVQFYLRRFNGELGRQVLDVAPEALRRLHGYSWPGNVRELQSVLKQALLRARGTMLAPEFLPELSAASAGAASPDSRTEWDLQGFVNDSLREAAGNLYADAHLAFDRQLIPIVLQLAGGSQLQAAKILGIARQTLRNRLRELGLNVTKSVAADGHSLL